MQRGSCDFVVKVENAEAAGAIGSVIFNEGQPPDRTDVVFGTLGEPVGIPAVDTSFALGNELANGAHQRADRNHRPHRHQDDLDAGNHRERDRRDKKGDARNVVMAGAHLDSVAEGPGINDNGSGSATLIELARQMSKQRVKPTNRVRFAWWGAEESGLFGSQEYIDQLSERSI